jgi:hypothetical protein
MSLFYKSEAITPTISSALAEALITNPQTVKGEEHKIAADKAKEVMTKVKGKLAVGRVISAFVLLAIICGAGIWSENYENLKRWTDVLFDAFKVGLPGLIGLLIGETTGKSQ